MALWDLSSSPGVRQPLLGAVEGLDLAFLHSWTRCRAGQQAIAEQIRNVRRITVPCLAMDGVWIYQPGSRSILHVAKCNGPE